VKPAPFAYHDPDTVDEVVALLRAHGDDVKVLAGGQSLVPMLALRLARFGHLVDVNRVGGLAGAHRVDGTLRIGATTRQRALERDPAIGAAVPLLAVAAPHIGHFQIRNRGTVGGSLAHADPASELPAVALALDAVFEANQATHGARLIAAADFFTGPWTTCLEEDELLTSVRFPVWEGDVRASVQEVARRHGDFALAGAAVQVTRDGRQVTRAAIGLIGMGPTPVRALDAERALAGGATARDAAELAVRDTDPTTDIHATSAQRRRLAVAMVERAIREVTDA
jgi:carbon-monoxide dehydrogenase medium subunit